MSEVEFLDSTGLGVLVGGLKKVRAHDGSLQLIGQPGFVNSDPGLSSNWEQIPRNMNYSLATPFPSPAATLAGFKWKSSLGANFPLLADINPGTRGGANPPNNVVGPGHDASPRDMATS